MIIGDLTRADFKRELPKAIGTWSSRYHRADLHERYVV